MRLEKSKGLAFPFTLMRKWRARGCLEQVFWNEAAHWPLRGRPSGTRRETGPRGICRSRTAASWDAPYNGGRLRSSHNPRPRRLGCIKRLPSRVTCTCLNALSPAPRAGRAVLSHGPPVAVYFRYSDVGSPSKLAHRALLTVRISVFFLECPRGSCDL